MKKHKNFWEITEDSLDHTMETFKIKKEMRNELLNLYKELSPYPEVKECLEELKAKKINEKYIVPPKTTDFAIVYAPTESLFSELTSYRDPSTKELLTQELMRKHKITISGPNTLSAYLQSLHMGFQTLKVQKHATQIYDDLRTISSRFTKHFDGILSLRKILEEALNHTDDFGRDARSIMRTLENIKDPEQVEKTTKEEVDKIKVLNK